MIEVVAKPNSEQSVVTVSPKIEKVNEANEGLKPKNLNMRHIEFDVTTKRLKKGVTSTLGLTCIKYRYKYK